MPLGDIVMGVRLLLLPLLLHGYRISLLEPIIAEFGLDLRHFFAGCRSLWS